MTTIRFGGLNLRFVQDKRATGGSLDAFEMTVQPKAKMPVAHYHEGWEETVYGLAGTTIWRLDGIDHAIGPGDCVFIRRGVVHGFRNASDASARCLCVLTPGVLGPDYFLEMEAVVNADAGAPDPARMREVMQRHGLVPRPEG